MIDKNFYEIIAIRFDNLIIFGKPALNQLQKNKHYDQLISRLEFIMLSRLDLDDKWGKYAENVPTLFKLSEDTEFNIRQSYKTY